MAYATGTATDAVDLLDKFRTFIKTDSALAAESPSQVWVEEAFEDDGTGLEKRLYLRGPGLAASDNIHVNLRLFDDSAAAGTGNWSLVIKGATSYNSGLSYDLQPGVSPFNKAVPLWNQSMTYWFFANGRRFMIVALVSTSYSSCYGGFLLPYSPAVTALEYPYPLYIGATCGASGYAHSEADRNAMSFWDPGYQSSSRGTASIYTPGNQWKEVRNYDTSSSATNPSEIASPGFVVTYPYYGTSISATAGGRIRNIRELLDGDYLLTDVQVFQPDISQAIRDHFGALDGVCHIAGVGTTPGSTITVGSDTYTIFRSAWDSSQGTWVALKQ